MGELPAFGNSKESSDKDKDAKKDPKKLVPPIPFAARPPAPPEIAPPAPPPALLEQLISKGISVESSDDTKTDEKDEKTTKKEEAKPTATDAAAKSEVTPEATDTAGPLAATSAELPPQTAEDETVAPAEDGWGETLELHPRPEAPPEDEAETTPPTLAATPTRTTPPPNQSPLAPERSANEGPWSSWGASAETSKLDLKFNQSSRLNTFLEQFQTKSVEADPDAGKRALRKGLIAGFITGYAVKAYIANRKHERYEKSIQKQINQRDEQIATFQREQQRLTDRLRQEQLAKNQASRFEKPQPKPEVRPQQAIEQQIFDEQGNQIILQPGWRVERSAGGYSVVLDEHNRIVHDAIRYGEAYQRDQKREQLSNDLFTALGGGAPAGGPTNVGYGLSPGGRPQPTGSAAPNPLSPAPGTVDLRHRLPQPRNPVAATFLSPWLWTIVAVLLIIYFIAALA